MKNMTHKSLTIFSFPEVIFTMARTLFETQPAAAYTGEYGYG